MITLDAKQTSDALDWTALIEALRRGFAVGCTAPLRHTHEFETSDELPGTLLLMPAWGMQDYLGVKQVLVIPENAKRNLSSVCPSYQLFSTITGQALLSLDGATLTNRRTAAASALAADYLAKPDARSLLIVGTAGLAESLAHAHSTIRSIQQIKIWGRNSDKAKKLADKLCAMGLNAEPVEDLASETPTADIVSCATSSKNALIKGEWLQPGCHLDLVGAFTPAMRESDDEAVLRSKLFVDTYEGALSEAGDIMMPLANGVISKNDLLADLTELCREEHQGRSDPDQITLFKSVGTALEDLAAAVLAYQNAISARA